MIIVDTPTKYKNLKGKWSHLVASTVEELHDFARTIGCKKEWFQDKPDKPHYTLTEEVHKQACYRGAMKVSRKQLLQFLKINYPEHYMEKDDDISTEILEYDLNNLKPVVNIKPMPAVFIHDDYPAHAIRKNPNSSFGEPMNSGFVKDANTGVWLAGVYEDFVPVI